MARLYRAVCMTLCLTALCSVMTWASPPDGCRNYCLGNFTTSVNGGASDWGMGSSCTDAQAALNSAVSNRAENNCTSVGYLWACSVTTVVTGGCFFNGTMFQVDGYANYKCMAEICP